MKKSLVIVLAVAIIGILGVLSKQHGNSMIPPSGSPASTLGANTSETSSQAAQTGVNSSSTSTTNSSNYKDGTFMGASEDTPYGTVQIAAVIKDGKISNINFIQMPYEEGHSREITSYSEPYLKDETIQKQTARIDFVSGATTTSEAYEQSLQAALDQAV